MNSTYYLNIRLQIIAISMLLLSTTSYLPAQGTSYLYRVWFRDKGDYQADNITSEMLLSARAINRRLKAGIQVPDYRDVPVRKEYLGKITALGFKLHCTSKWMNTALFDVLPSSDIDTLLALPFVDNIQVVKTPGKKSSFKDKLAFQLEEADPDSFDRPVTMLNGQPLHNTGYYGKGILIAVLDGGFTNADQASSLAKLRINNGIWATRDFVSNTEYVYNSSTHGTAVLSILAGDIPGEIEGTAKEASFLLLKTEDVESEYPCEEDFWVAGAEFADSSGADIISSSLGYYNFDDPSLNYKISDLDGNSAFVTRAADIAASKGILVVNSAGNERDQIWRYIIFPSDGDSVLAVGAADGINKISSFSSCGPAADKRIKPDNTAMGVSVPVQASIDKIGRSNGTSFSCPVLSGMAACLMQAVPGATNSDIIEALHMSADRYNVPDSLYGYGIPDMSAALNILQDKYVNIPDKLTSVGPNPTTGNIEITFREPPGSLRVEIISMSGRMIFLNYIPDFAGRTYRITELQNREQGIYLIRLITGDGVFVHKIIKIRN